MPPYERHLFICEHRRDPGSAKGCCATKGSPEMRQKLKKMAFDAGLKGRIRVNSAGCLGFCECGVSMVVYPDGVWYGEVTEADLDDIFREHLLEGRPVERLRRPTPGDPQPT